MFDIKVYETTAYKYCKRIVEGKVISNKWMILFAKKFINDIERSKDDNFPYFFDVQKAFFIEDFIYQLKYTEGLKVGQNIKLADFQANIVQNAFCWRLKEDKSIYRYREIIVYLPRKQGKSYICSILGLLAMMLETNAEVVNGAGKLSQAQILVNMAIKLVKTNKDLSRHFNIYKRHLEFDGSFFKAVSNNAETMDGMNISTCIIDESMIVDRALRDSLTSGFLMRKNYQTFMISTEYDVNHEDNWFVEMLDYAKTVLEGTLEDERILAIMYSLDDKSEIHNKDIWIKSCPILEEVPSSSIENDYKKALENPSIMKNLLIKQFNVPQINNNNDNAYLRMDKWKTCGLEKIDLENKEIYLGLDLSRTTDLTALSMIYKENNIYYVKAIGFLPQDSLENRREKLDYKLLESREECFIVPGTTIDDEFIEDFIHNIKNKYGCTIKGIYADPYNASRMLQRLSREFEVVEVRQGYSLSPATKYFRDQVYLNKVRYEKSQLFDWCMSNCVTTTDRNDNELLDKKNKNKTRIDLVAATINAMTECMNEKEEFSLGEIFMG